MAKHYKYPNANYKYNTYNNLANTLSYYKSNIQSEISSSAITVNLESTGLSGDSYDEYVIKKDEWLVEVTTMQTVFNNFLSNLTACIANSKAKANLWKSRINIMEED